MKDLELLFVMILFYILYNPFIKFLYNVKDEKPTPGTNENPGPATSTTAGEITDSEGGEYKITKGIWL